MIPTQTTGLGCRPLGYALYGATAILILFLAVTSTILVRNISETLDDKPSPIVKSFTAFIAITLRRVSRSLAFINATELVAISCLQFSHLIDNCYCNASVIGRGTGSYILVSLEGWISTMRASRIAGAVISVASMAIYVIFLRVFNSLPSEIIDDLSSFFTFTLLASRAIFRGVGTFPTATITFRHVCRYDILYTIRYHIGDIVVPCSYRARSALLPALRGRVSWFYVKECGCSRCLRCMAPRSVDRKVRIPEGTIKIQDTRQPLIRSLQKVQNTSRVGMGTVHQMLCNSRLAS